MINFAYESVKYLNFLSSGAIEIFNGFVYDYHPNVEKNDMRKEICTVFSKIFPGYNANPSTVICDGCLCKKENSVLQNPVCKARKCVNEKGIKHCGYCEQYPCDIFPAEPTYEMLVQKIDIEKQWTWEDEKLM